MELKDVKVSLEYYHRSDKPERIYFREAQYSVPDYNRIETKELGYIELKQEEEIMTGYSRPNTMGTVVIACFVLLLIWAFVS